MAAEAYRHDGTAFRKATELYRNDGTAWRKCKERWRFDGTAWRKVFASGSVVVTPLASGTSSVDAVTGTSSLGQITFGSGGAITYLGYVSGPTAWATSPAAGVGSAVYIRATVTAGFALSVNPASAWTLLSINQAFKNGPGTSGSRSSTITFDFSLDGGASIVTSSSGWVIEFTHNI